MLKTLRSFVPVMMFALMLLLTVGSAFAQYDPCEIPPGNYASYTQGGWGAACNGGNIGCVRDQYFDTIFPSGLTVGGYYNMHFTSALAVNNYIPTGSTPAMLNQNYVDPANTSAGEFGGQIVALALTLGFSNANIAGFNPNFGLLVVPYGVDTPNGPFAGWNVNAIFAVANQVVGGDANALPPGITLPELNTVLTAINQSFDNGDTSTYYLVEPDCDRILPVEVKSFDAAGGQSSITVRWMTASENSVAYYELSRSDGEAWHSVGRFNSEGNSATGHVYVYSDVNVLPGVTYSYRLVIREINGTVIAHNEVASASLADAAAPTEFALMQNYPNPFNPSTSITYTLKEASHVRLTVFDPVGRQVATLDNGDRGAGSHTVQFDGSNLSAGLYFYRLEAGSFKSVRKLVLIK